MARIGGVAAGAYSGVNAFLDAAAFAALVFAPADLPIDVGIQHALLGYMLMQFVVTRLSGASSMITPVSYEVIPFLSKFALVITRAVVEEGKPAAAALSTVLVGSAMVNFGASLLFATGSCLPVGEGLSKLLPEPMQAGLFAAIGFTLYELSFETLKLAAPLAMLADGSLFDTIKMRLWVTANALGIALWMFSRLTSHPALFPAFVLGITLWCLPSNHRMNGLTRVCVVHNIPSGRVAPALARSTHAVRSARNMSLDEARAGGWLMEATTGRPCWTLWEARSFAGARFDLIFMPDAIRELICAVLFGPVINTILNLVLISPVVGKKLQIHRELLAHSAGSLAIGAAGGYSNYLAISNTAIHIKCGGRDRFSCYAAASVAGLFLLVHPLFSLVGYVPTLVVATTCVYIGVDFLVDNLLRPVLSGELGVASVSWFVFALCQQVGVLWGVIIGAMLCQLGLMVMGARNSTTKAKTA